MGTSGFRSEISQQAVRAWRLFGSLICDEKQSWRTVFEKATFMKRIKSKVLGDLKVSNNSREEPVICDRLKAEDFALTKTSRYGFPYQPTCIAYDPVQRLLAIGTNDGSLRILGQAGVESHVQHDVTATVKRLIFLVNEGALISQCGDDFIHLWNLRQAQPAVVQSLRFNREKITFLHLCFKSKWLYVGTAKGNILVVNIETFKVSGYVINWNKVIELQCKTHPGPVVHISANPEDPNKLLLGYEIGMVAMWSLRSKAVEQRFYCSQKSLTAAHWLSDGKQFMCAHTEGVMTVWNLKNTSKPIETVSPYGRSDKGRPCAPVYKIQWMAVSSGEPVLIFSGGTNGGKRKGLTFMQGKTVKAMATDTIIDFVCLTTSPWNTDAQDPIAVVAVTTSKLLMFDLLSSSTKTPILDVPYTFNIHESPVTCTQYYSECPPDLLKALSTVGSRPKKKRLQRDVSNQVWPVTGGVLGEVAANAPADLIITGHADGSVKFWDVSAAVTTCLYKLSTNKVFDKDRHSRSAESADGADENDQSDSSGPTPPQSPVYDPREEDLEPYAVHLIQLCVHSRTLVVSGSSHVLVYQFSLSEQNVDLVQMDIKLNVEPCSEARASPVLDTPSSPTSSPRGPPPGMVLPSLSCKTGGYKRLPGFQAELGCLVSPCGSDGVPIRSIALSSKFGVVSFSNGISMAVVDIVQKKLITVLSAQDMSNLSESPTSNFCPPTPGTPGSAGVDGGPIEFTAAEDRAKGLERRKTRPPRPPPPTKRNSKSDIQNGSEAVDGQSRHRALSGCDSNGPPDNIQCMHFAYTFTRKNDSLLSPCLWVGTVFGHVFVVVLSLPAGDERECQPVLSIITGTVFHPKAGMVLSMAILDGQGHLFPSPFQFWQEKDSHSKGFPRESSKTHFAVLCTEKEVVVYLLPPSHTNPTSYSRASIVEDSAVVLKASIVTVQGSTCLICLNSLGKLLTLSLPKLTPLLDVECSFLMTDYRFVRTLVFADEGKAIILCSPYEIQRLSFYARNESLSDTSATLFTAVDTPEAPSKGFFSSLFSSAASPLDRELLFGAESGAASRSVAERIQGPGMEKLQETSSGLMGVMARNKQAALERGEKLSELEKKTAEMSTRAQGFSEVAHKVSQKYKDKKWYQV